MALVTAAGDRSSERATDYLNVHQHTIKSMAERGDIPMGHPKEGKGMRREPERRKKAVR
jgi:hypothetical protein